ncbi:MAG: hypothetical protein GXP40_11540 [Chloroflexi bacterium]|nr:hypothetical protein [Chloroflexota bacterium]
MNVTILVPVFLGWLAGALVNYLADVLPARRRLDQPTCPQCGTQIRWADYWLLRNCRACGRHRSWRTWTTYVLGLVATVQIWLFPPRGLGFVLGFILLVYLATVFIIDVEHRLILHPVSVFGALLGLAIGIILHGTASTLIGGAAGFGIMFILYYFGVLFARMMSRRRGETIEEGDALGFGDVNLAGILGLLLGWPLIWIGLLTAILAGGAVSLMLILGMLALKRYRVFTAIPYAPFLILSAVFLLYR